MNRLKKILVFSVFTLLTLMLIFAFSSCGKKEKITVKSTVKYLTEDDYFAGDIDGKLKDSLTVGIEEKAYFVIDYTLSGVDMISEDTVATFCVSFDEETEEIIGKSYCSIVLEETPSSDYSEKDNGYTYNINVKIYGGEKGEKSFRFIFSVSKSTAGKILPSAELIVPEINGKKLFNIDGNGHCFGRVTVDESIVIESKLSYQLSSDGSYYTVDGLGRETGDIIEIPDKYRDIPVKEISDNVFNNCTYLKGVKLPGELIKIGAGAFKGCTNITDMRIPLSVTEIGSEAFAGCPNMHVRCEATEMPVTWNENCISGVAGLTWNCNVLFEFKLSYDGKYYTMVKSEGVTGDVVIPSIYNGLPVTALDMSFSECRGLTSVTIPDSITEIGRYAFYNCDSLTSISIPHSVTVISSMAFYNCAAIKTVIIPNSVTSIGSSAFYNCRSLTSVEIGSGVTSIGYDAFKNCGSLTSVKFADKSSWYYEPHNSITGAQTQIDVTNDSENAKNLSNKYVNCYWEKK